MARREKLEVGSRIWWDGEAWKISGFFAGEVELLGDRGKARVHLPALTETEDFRVLSCGAEIDHRPEEPAFINDLPEAERQAAVSLERHLLEAVTGFRLGHESLALKGEPREDYDPELNSVRQRMSRKAKELGVSWRTLWRHKENYEKRGLIGLIDERKITATKAFPKVDDRVKLALQRVLDELTDESNVTKENVARRVRRQLALTYPGVEVPLPSRNTFSKLIDRLAAGRGLFGAAKARRSISNRPATPYRRFAPVRPGEVVLIDSTPLDAYAIDPVTFRWVQVQLTVALDLFTRSLVGWRFTPVSTKRVDAALLLYDVLHPKAMRRGWPESARWPYVGVPEAVVLELVGEDELEDGVAGIPFVNPETVWVDRGRVFLSRAFKDACLRLGVDLQLARPYTPTDKAHVERVFRTIREKFVMDLPGYKGPDLFSRGRDVENQAFYFIDEIEALFAEWVATYWQRRSHEGLELPALPRMKLSPNDMYEEGLMRAGFVYVLPEPSLYFELLPTEWRLINHYGIELGGLIYDSEVLAEYRNVPSPYLGVHQGKYPIRFDPRDLSEVFFFDVELGEWQAIPRRGAGAVNRPFNDATLSYAKSLVLARGENVRSNQEVERALDELLGRMTAMALDGRKERKLAAVRAVRTMEAAKEKALAAPKRQDQAMPAPDEPADFDDLFTADETSFISREASLPLEEVGDIARVLPTVSASDDYDI
jgi:transposase InsO family protein